MDPLALLQEFVSLPGPPGLEDAVRDAVAAHVARLGFQSEIDAKGNLIVNLGGPNPKVVVTAHLDEIAMIVREIDPDGSLIVDSMGGLYPWKLGEGPVDILSKSGTRTGILSFGGIHTEEDGSTVEQTDRLEWSQVRIILGEEPWADLRPGTRVVVSPSRRGLTKLGDLVAGHFLDDRADLVSWLLALEKLKKFKGDVAFVATVAEEVGGEGALFYLQNCRPDVCIALELGPNVADAPVEITDQPTVWVTDSYSTMSAADGDLVAEVGEELGLELQWQALSRGGSDASCAASHGLCARPITLGLPMENSHGYEVMHPGAMTELARLTVGLVKRLA